MARGTILFLNGVSSSGKTTLAKALQARLAETYYLLSNDMFCDTVPEKHWDIDQPEAEYQALTLLHYTIRLFSDMGRNVIVDHVLVSGQKGALLKECVHLLHDHPVLLVHVVCSSLEELRRRERARGDRSIGQAESQLPMLVPREPYDITVDTAAGDMDICVDAIVKRMAEPKGFAAFRELYEML